MKKNVTVTSKRQITIPVKIYDELQLKVDSTLIMDSGPGYAVLRSPMHSFYKLAGTLRTPKQYKDMSLDHLIKISREHYITDKYKKKK